VDHVKPLAALGDVPVDQAVLGKLYQRTPGRSRHRSPDSGGPHRTPAHADDRESRVSADLSGSVAPRLSGNAGGGRDD
jgi:hypothetical protein